MNKYLVLIMLLGSSTMVRAQLDSMTAMIDTAQDSTKDESYNEAKFSIQTGNNLVQLGQSMSTNELYLRPGINFYHKTGLYVGGNLTLMPMDSTKKLDNFNLSIGYDRDISKFFTIGIDYTFSQYYTTKQIASSAAHMISPYITWENKILSPTLTPVILLGTTTDLALQFDLSHIFVFKSVFHPKGKLTIPISVGAIGGTSEYYSTYTTRRKGRNVTISTTKSQVAITSVYAMATMKYKIKRTAFSFNTSYYYSTDPNDTGVSNNRPIFRFIAAYYL
jgi:hypothetical protein